MNTIHKQLKAYNIHKFITAESEKFFTYNYSSKKTGTRTFSSRFLANLLNILLAKCKCENSLKSNGEKLCGNNEKISKLIKIRKNFIEIFKNAKLKISGLFL